MWTTSQLGTPNVVLRLSNVFTTVCLRRRCGRERGPGHPYGQLPSAFIREIRHFFHLSSPLVSLSLSSSVLSPTPFHASRLKHIQESIKAVADILPPCHGIIARLHTHPMAPPCLVSNYCTRRKDHRFTRPGSLVVNLETTSGRGLNFLIPASSQKKK